MYQRIKKEGAAQHPDEIESEVSDGWYIRQAAAYIRDSGDKDTYFVRDNLRPHIAAALAKGAAE